MGSKSEMNPTTMVQVREDFGINYDLLTSSLVKIYQGFLKMGLLSLPTLNACTLKGRFEKYSKHSC